MARSVEVAPLFIGRVLTFVKRRGCFDAERKVDCIFQPSFTPEKKLSSIYECELMAIVLAMKKWHYYLLGHTFIIKTGQKALKFI